MSSFRMAGLGLVLSLLAGCGADTFTSVPSDPAGDGGDGGSGGTSTSGKGGSSGAAGKGGSAGKGGAGGTGGKGGAGGNGGKGGSGGSAGKGGSGGAAGTGGDGSGDSGAGGDMSSGGADSGAGGDTGIGGDTGAAGMGTAGTDGGGDAGGAGTDPSGGAGSGGTGNGSAGDTGSAGTSMGTGGAGESGSAGTNMGTGGAGESGSAGTGNGSAGSSTGDGGYLVSNHSTVGGFQTGGDSLTTAGKFSSSTDCIAGSVLGNCQVVATTDGPPGGLCVCRSENLSLGALEISPSDRGVVLLVSDTVKISGIVRVLSGGQPWPGNGTSGWSGGRGASFGSTGGWGPATYGTESLEPLLGGMGGQPVCTSASCSSKAKGGLGGGALQISAGKQLIVEATGIVDAGGTGGLSLTSGMGGPGGGSGGGILLEAPFLSIEGIVVANGGGGAGAASDGSSGDSGYPGSRTLYGASGGNGRDGGGCYLSGYTVGGDGGVGAAKKTTAGKGQAGDFRSCIPNAQVGEGGGGGGFGRIRFRHATGSSTSYVVGTKAILSPEPSVASF